jgi:hypothetical protein
MTTYIDSLLGVPPRSDEALERVRPQMAALRHDDILDMPEATGTAGEPVGSDNVPSTEQPKGSIESSVSKDVDDPFIR